MTAVCEYVRDVILPLLGAGVIALLIVDWGTRGIDYGADQ